MSDVTDVDREKAQSMMGWGGLSDQYLTGLEIQQRDAIAAALADEREKARDQFCALLAVSPTLVDDKGDPRGYLVSLPLLSTIGIDADRIQRAAEESE